MSVVDHPTRHRAPEHDASGTAEVRAWWDPGLAAQGFEVRGAYVERYWLGVLGPSALFLVRRLARGLDEHPGGFRMDLADTARAIGLGGGTGRQSPIVRTIDRCCMFNVMRRTGPGQLEVRTHLPRLTRRQLERLPLAVQRSHDSFLAHPSNGGRGGGPPGPSAA